MESSCYYPGGTHAGICSHQAIACLSDGASWSLLRRLSPSRCQRVCQCAHPKQQGLPRAPTPAPRAPPANTTGGVGMQNRSAGDAGESSRRGLLHLPSGMRGGVLPSQNFQPTAVRNKRAQARNGDVRRISRLEQTRSAHHFPCSERDSDLGNSWAGAASTMLDEGTSRRGIPVVVEAPPLRRRMILGVYLRRPFRGPTGAWKPRERSTSPRPIPVDLFGPPTRSAQEGGTSP